MNAIVRSAVVVLLICLMAQSALADEPLYEGLGTTGGEGKRLFGEGQQAKLKLIEAKPFKEGVVLMVYEKAVN